jgi:nucleotide-binding universal stress UspA family protein
MPAAPVIMELAREGEAMTEDGSATRGTIVVGVDGSDHSRKALRWGAQLAAIFGARLHAVIAWEYPPSFGWAAVPGDWDPREDTLKLLQQTVGEVFGDEPPTGLELQVREGSAARALLDASEGASLLVVGSRGHGGFAGLLLGSVSANVAEHAQCPVLIIHGDQVPPTSAGSAGHTTGTPLTR